jgi:hypothetical protein
MQAKQAEESPFFIGQQKSGTHEEIFKHAGPTVQILLFSFIKAFLRLRL